MLVSVDFNTGFMLRINLLMQDKMNTLKYGANVAEISKLWYFCRKKYILFFPVN